MDHSGDAKAEYIFDVRSSIFNAMDAEISAFKTVHENAPSFLTPSKKIFSKINITADELFPIAQSGLQDGWGRGKELTKELLYSKIDNVRAAEVEETKSVAVRKDKIADFMAHVDSSDSDGDMDHSSVFPDAAAPRRGGGGGRNAQRRAVAKPILVDALAATGNPIELNRRKSSWEKWSGNKPISSQLLRFMRNDAKSTSGEMICIPFKPVVWQRATAVAAATAAATKTTALAVLEERDESKKTFATRYSSNTVYWNDLSFASFVLSIPYIQHLPGFCVKSLEENYELLHFKDGQTVVQQGQPISSIFIIRDGAVEVTRLNGSRSAQTDKVHLLTSGDMFGYNPTTFASDGSAPSNFSYKATRGGAAVYAVENSIFETCAAKLSSEEDNNEFSASRLDLFTTSNAYDPPVDESMLGLHSALVREMFSVEGQSPKTEGGAAPVAAKSVFEMLTENKKTCLANLTHFSSPEIDFDEGIENAILQIKELFGVDRVGFYVIDKLLNNMILYVSQQAGKSAVAAVAASDQPGNASAGAATSTPAAGFRMPLKGIAAHVAVQNRLLNLPDAYENKLFDPSMDLRTGYRTKQMLCVPVTDCGPTGGGVVVGAIQLINPVDGRTFGSNDEALADIVSRFLGSKSYLFKSKSAAMSPYMPLSKVDGVFTVRLRSVLTFKGHRHLKCTVRLMKDGHMHGAPVVTPLTSITTYFQGGAQYTRCDFNQDIDFDGLQCRELPQSARLLIQVYSRNNHGAGWSGVNLFAYDRAMTSGTVVLNMWDGECPEDSESVPTRLQALATGTQPCGSITLEFGAYSKTVMHEVNGPPLRQFSLNKQQQIAHSRLGSTADQNSSDYRSLDWYVNHLTDGERVKFNAASRQQQFGYVMPANLDTETKQLLWRMRVQLSTEASWALPLFLLSIDWFNSAMVYEALALMHKWVQPAASEVIQLLDHRFSDARVRSYAVGLLFALVTPPQLLRLTAYLVGLLKFEPYQDSALARMLLWHALHQPLSLGRQLMWQLASSVEADPVGSLQCLALQRAVMRGMSCETRVKVLLGHAAMHKLKQLHGIMRDSPLVRKILAKTAAAATKTQSGSAAEEGLSVEVYNLYLDELQKQKLPKEFYWPLPLHALNLGEGIATVERVKNKLFSFLMTMRAPDAHVSAHSGAVEQRRVDPKYRLLCTEEVDVTVESALTSMQHVLDFIWSQDGLELRAVMHSVVRMGTEDSKFGIVEVPPDSQTIKALITADLMDQARALKAANPSRKPEMQRRAVPINLVTKFMKIDPTQETSLSIAESDKIRRTFMHSLAAFLVYSHVLSLGSIGAEQTYVSADGHIFVKNPDCVLAIESTTALKPRKPKISTVSFGPQLTAYPLFFMPCFQKVLGTTSDTEALMRDFNKLVWSAFSSIRRRASLLVSALLFLASKLNIQVETVNETIDTLQNALFMKLSDEAAQKEITKLLGIALKVDHSVSVTM